MLFRDSSLSRERNVVSGTIAAFVVVVVVVVVYYFLFVFSPGVRRFLHLLCDYGRKWLLTNSSDWNPRGMGRQG